MCVGVCIDNMKLYLFPTKESHPITYNTGEEHSDPPQALMALELNLASAASCGFQQVISARLTDTVVYACSRLHPFSPILPFVE